MMSADTPFVDGPTTQDALPVVHRTSRSISRRVGELVHEISLISVVVFYS